ncbi:ATP-binding protein [Pontiella sulfatireligans]|uniref:histidine kinase n=1 Tax=Pontiella sulfatireligans TaxID=2750658 RepID=A0A6C2UKC5_9BACT|nr:ATP-binding protein [Pontiella sulfatireligans]VGO20333.1 Sensor protein CzcS [Pontiella sulfatireligans]
MKLSFKFKIATISFAISGTLLTVFGMVFFAFIYQSGIDRMDREIRSLVEAQLRVGHPPEHWQNFDKSLKFIYGEGHISRIALLVSDSRDRTLFQSENAPAVLAALPRPALPSPPEQDRPGTKDHLEHLDKNKDGRISHDEFDGPAHVFYEADADDDGFIATEEIAELDAPPFRRPPMDDQPPLSDVAAFQTQETPSGSWRIGIFRDPELTVIVAMDMNAFYADINRFRVAFMVAVPLGLLLLGITGWFLAAGAMRPVAIIADTAEGITAKGLDKRIPMVGNDEELERLVRVSNGMLDRLETSYHQAVRFSADAAHELQTPLTILQGELDNAIQSSEDGSTEQQRYSMLLEELRNLKSVVQKLLLLAHADEGRLNINTVPVDLSELIHNATEDIEIMAPKLKIDTHIGERIEILADPALLNQTIRNMASNAAKYADENGHAVFTLEQDKQAVRFTLANTAPPIPDEDQPLLFDRFHRVEKSRTTAGSGLGLSLAREIARAHGGDLVLDPYKDGMVSFTLTLPIT